MNSPRIRWKIVAHTWKYAIQNYQPQENQAINRFDRSNAADRGRCTIGHMMNPRKFLITACLATGALFADSASAQLAQSPVIRLAELEIDPLQLEAFKAAGIDHANTVIHSGPGVLAFHAVAEKDNPARVRVFEMYRDADAYQSHLRSRHFEKFLSTTNTMIVSRKLIEVTPILLGAKPELKPASLVRFAEIEINPAQLQAYKAAVSEEIQDSIQKEPGVLTIYSVALKDSETQLRFFEIYADDRAYREHIESPHFKKYVAATQSMITSRKLFEMTPIFLNLKTSTN